VVLRAQREKRSEKGNMPMTIELGEKFRRGVRAESFMRLSKKT